MCKTPSTLRSKVIYSQARRCVHPSPDSHPKRASLRRCIKTVTWPHGRRTCSVPSYCRISLSQDTLMASGRIREEKKETKGWMFQDKSLTAHLYDHAHSCHTPFTKRLETMIWSRASPSMWPSHSLAPDLSDKLMGLVPNGKDSLQYREAMSTSRVLELGGWPFSSNVTTTVAPSPGPWLLIVTLKVAFNGKNPPLQLQNSP